MRIKLVIIYIVLILYSCKNNTNKYEDNPFKRENEYSVTYKDIILKHNCFSSGMDEYIAKPFDPQDLLGKLWKLKFKV